MTLGWGWAQYTKIIIKLSKHKILLNTFLGKIGAIHRASTLTLLRETAL